MKKLNKKGFTLVEVVIGSAILGMIGLAIVAMLNSSSSIINIVQKKTSLLSRSQVTSVQIQEMLVNASDAIAVNTNSSYDVYHWQQQLDDEGNLVRNNGLAQHEWAQVLNTANEIYIADKSSGVINVIFQRDDELWLRIDKPSPSGTIVTESEAPICHKVKSCDYSVNTEKNKYGEDVAYAVKFVLSIDKFSYGYSKNEVVSLRNKPRFISLAEGDDYSSDEFFSAVEYKLADEVWPRG